MNKPIIIGFGGDARNGKDSAGIILKEKLEQKGKSVLKINLADYLKFLVATYFGGSYERTPENRTKWQHFGTEKVREVDPNFWVDTIIRMLSVFGDDFDYVIISDVRFPNELFRFDDKDFETYSVKVERLNFENDLTPEQRLHSSETSMSTFPFDYYIKSENGLDKLEIEVNKFIEYMEEY
jgi:hypothetical protein